MIEDGRCRSSKYVKKEMGLGCISGSCKARWSWHKYVSGNKKYWRMWDWIAHLYKSKVGCMLLLSKRIFGQAPLIIASPFINFGSCSAIKQRKHQTLPHVLVCNPDFFSSQLSLAVLLHFEGTIFSFNCSFVYWYAQTHSVSFISH